MKILLVGINAKFIHSCLAVRSLGAYAKERYDIENEVLEFTINQREEEILARIYQSRPDLVGFSCYIWNISLVKELCSSLKKVLPGVKILLGGPEVSYTPLESLRETGGDYLLSGEGEESFSRLCKALLLGRGLEKVPSLSWLEEGVFRQNRAVALPRMEDLPFVYRDLSPFENRILYYEAQRGCPFRCSYCLSSVEKGVRFRPLALVKQELSFFLERRVRQVKFVDRTFNANRGFAMEIWRFLRDNDNGVTNFHFELEASLLAREEMDFLKTVRPGLFQFEIGVQSTNPPTLEAVCRKDGFAAVAAAAGELIREGRIHIHLDLIAGLPMEGFDRFGRSYNEVYALRPHQLQLGFLKLLKGSGLRQKAEEYGIICKEYPPYEVVSTRWLDFSELLRLKMVEELNESYYNSRRFCYTLEYLVGEDPFCFFLKLGEFAGEREWFSRPHTVFQQYGLLCDYARAAGRWDEGLAQRMRLDYIRHEKPKKLPDFFGKEPEDGRFPLLWERIYRQDGYRALLGEEISWREAERVSHLALFPFDPMTGEEGMVPLFFDYRYPDLEGNGRIIKLSFDSRNL